MRVHKKHIQTGQEVTAVFYFGENQDEVVSFIKAFGDNIEDWICYQPFFGLLQNNRFVAIPFHTWVSRGSMNEYFILTPEEITNLYTEIN